MIINQKKLQVNKNQQKNKHPFNTLATAIFYYSNKEKQDGLFRAKIRFFRKRLIQIKKPLRVIFITKNSKGDF